jgi:hypothetical protein
MTQENFSTAGDTNATGEPVANGVGQTVEEIEASWQHRFSQRDKAHNAETAALHAQIDALKAAPVKAPEGESPEAGRVRELEAALQQERAARQAAVLQSKYPMASAVLGDSIIGMPEEKIAAAEAAMDTGTGRPPIIDPNAAPRRGAAMQTTAKPMKDKSKDELLGDLRKLAPAYQQALRDGVL